MTNSENIESFCRNCVSRDFVSNKGLVCKRTRELPDFGEECQHYVVDEKLAAMAPAVGAEVIEEEQLIGKENLPKAIICGLLACFVGAFAWGIVSVTTGYQIGYMAIGVGFIVGMAMRWGNGRRPLYGYIGAALALFSCLLGDYFSIIGFVAKEYDMSYWEMLVATNVADVMPMLVENLMSMTIAFYGMAIYEGYKLSFHEQNKFKGGKI